MIGHTYLDLVDSTFFSCGLDKKATISPDNQHSSS